MAAVRGWVLSLLDRGPHTLDVYPETTRTDDLGNVTAVPSAAPVRILAAVQPVTSDELSAAGQDLLTTYRVICRDAPLGAWARIRWVDGGGTWWDVIGQPRRYGMSPRTGHIDAIIRARKDAPTPGEDPVELGGGGGG